MEFSRREAIRIGAITTLGIGSTLTAKASTAYDIDLEVGATLDSFYLRRPWSRGFAQRSAGILVFPTIFKAGFGFGGEYGEGSLLTRGHPAEYYNTVSASFGFQLGANTIHSPIVGFIFDQRGLMYNLTLEGSKISRIYR
jgi:lipid-binding SYLF domain-containing protein